MSDDEDATVPAGAEVLKVGDVFESVEDAKQKVKEFGATNFVDFKVETNNKTCLRMFCKHGGRVRDKKGKGERVKQHYNNLGCKASVTFYKSTKDNSITCNSINSDHTHPVSEGIYNRDNVNLDEVELDLCANLRNGNCKPSQIRRVLLEKFKKDITIQKLKNVLRKIPSEPDADLNFEEFFLQHEEEGGHVDWLDDPDGTVRCMTFASNTMISAYHASDPPVIQLDTTFEVEEARYKLMAAVYLNPTTNKSEVSFMALMCDETNETMNFALSRFKTISLHSNLIFIVDKDFGQLAVLSSLFPDARILLCIFHAIKFMKTLIASAPVLVSTKMKLVDQFKTVLYSNTEEIFKVQDRKFLRICGRITVTTGKKQSPLADYYIRNWQACKEMWVKCYRKNLPLLGDNTSNRVERYFWTIKKALTDTFLSLPSTVKAAVYLIKFADQRLQEKYSFAQNKVLIIHDEDPLIKKNNELASRTLNDRGCIIFHAAQKKMKESLERFSHEDDTVIEKFSANKSRTYQTGLDSCTCSFFLNHQAPCAHVLFLRLSSSEEFFTKDLFNPRYLRSEIPTDFLNNNREEIADEDPDLGNVSEEETVEDVALTDRQKYGMVMLILLRIGNLAACHPTKKFLKYLDGFNELEKRIRKGQNFMLQIQNIVTAAENSSEDEAETGHEFEGDNNIEGVLGEDEEIGENSNHGIAGLSDENRNDDTNVDMGNDSQDTVKQVDTSQEDSEIDKSGDNSSKFSSIVFKHGLRTKGRPKKRSRQFAFNKGSRDKRQNKRKVAKTKNSNKDFIDDEGEGVDSEEYEDGNQEENENSSDEDNEGDDEISFQS